MSAGKSERMRKGWWSNRRRTRAWIWQLLCRTAMRTVHTLHYNAIMDPTFVSVGTKRVGIWVITPSLVWHPIFLTFCVSSCSGVPLTQPKKNLKKCSCMIDRAKALKSVPPSQTEIPELTSCEIDGSYTAKQCNRQACWCVNPETGKKVNEENKDKSAVRC